MGFAAFLLMAAKLWLWAGAVVAAVFLTFGLGRLDEDAQDAFVFRALLVPGILLIWPLVLWRWWRLHVGEAFLPRYQPLLAHRAAAIAMAVVVVVALALSWTARQDWPADIAPEQLTEGQS